MKNSGVLFLLLPLLLTEGLGQKNLTNEPQKAELRIRVILEKENYAVNEPLFTRTEFTNVTKTTLCFPKPEQEYEEPIKGFLVVKGIGPQGRDWDHFVDHYDGVFPSDDGLIWEMQHTWIKLAPNATFTTDSESAHFTLDTPGEWKVSTAYYTPIAPFNASGSKGTLRTLGEQIGCMPPTVDASLLRSSFTCCSRLLKSDDVSEAESSRWHR